MAEAEVMYRRVQILCHKSISSGTLYGLYPKAGNTLVGSKLLFISVLDKETTNLFHKKIIPTTGSHSLFIDLSNDVFFHVFYHYLTKLSEIETAVIGPKHHSGACQNQIKTNEKIFFANILL